MRPEDCQQRLGSGIGDVVGPECRHINASRYGAGHIERMVFVGQHLAHSDAGLAFHHEEAFDLVHVEMLAPRCAWFGPGDEALRSLADDLDALRKTIRIEVLAIGAGQGSVERIRQAREHEICIVAVKCHQLGMQRRYPDSLTLHLVTPALPR